MGGTARQFNKIYTDYKKQFKKPINTIASLMPSEFSDDDFVAAFRQLYPHMWNDLEKQYAYWHERNEYLIKHGKKSRYNFRKPYEIYSRIGIAVCFAPKKEGKNHLYR